MVSLTLGGAIASAMALTSIFMPLAAAQSLPNLRILPLGDSITKGASSSDKCGYRKRLRQKLINYGIDSEVNVDMIGSETYGDMADNSHEGHSGKYLGDINTYWQLSIRARPNVVLIHAGTNNMDLNVDVDQAPSIMESIIDGVFDNAPDAVILVAPIIWANDAAMQARTDTFNQRLDGIINAKQKAGKHILSAPIGIGLSDLADKKHPNDAGYEKMAKAWFTWILDAHDRGWLKSPVNVNANELPGMGLGTGTGTGSGDASAALDICENGIWTKKGTIFEGFRTWEEVGTIVGPVENGRRDKVILADLNNDGIADYILADDDGTVRAWLNDGRPDRWVNLGKVNPPWSTIKGEMIRFADVDNDGKADLIALYPDGAAKVWKNVDNGRKFESLDSKWATGLESRDKIRILDMDGDGYADYVVLYAGGAVKWARNTHNNGKDTSKRNWEQAETIAPGPANMPAGRARLHDLDGDGRADYLIVYEGGAVKALRNTGNLNDGGTGQRNFDDLGTIAPGVSGVTGDMIRFADMDGDGLADFLAVADDGSIRMWKNLGIVGTKGASMRFADLDGDGKADIISVDARGRARAWLNKGSGAWDDIGNIAPGLDEDLSAAEIEFVDVNGDNLADYLVVYGDGAVKAYLNNGNIPEKTKDRIWKQGVVISSGVGEPGRNIRFADLNGDGYADYLVVFDDGAVDCYLNKKNIPPTNGGRIWEEKKRVATGVGEVGSKVRFADLTGDGKAEYIVQYLGGAAIAYNNTGNIPDVGKARNWEDMGTVALGVSPQGPVRYADISGDGKADYLVVFGGGSVNAYVNSCDWKAPVQDDTDPTQPPYIPDPVCASTVTSAAYPSKPTFAANEKPVEGESYFYIMENCYEDTRVDKNQGYKNRADFYKRAYKDAVLLASQTQDWPLRGIDASDLYFGKGSEEDKYSKDIHENLRMAAHWDQPKWGFDNYIVLGCSDSQNFMGSCESKIGSDPRSIGCYVNNTKSWWWNKSYVWCCDTFFNTDSLDDVYEQRKNNDKNNLDLRQLQSSGSWLLHEMMHTLEITGTKGEREHIVDLTFDGARGRRIYGPVDVAKAARAYGPERTHLNADSYAQFASARYWTNRFGGKVPQPSVKSSSVDVDYVSSIGDASVNHYDTCFSPPKDFDCDCGESGCSDTSAPCCANGSCQCHCDESGCGPTDPACCASGTCKWGS